MGDLAMATQVADPVIELLRFQARHVDEKDIRVLRSLVGLAGSKTNLRVTVSEDDEGDVVLVDVDDEQGSAAWPELNRGPVPVVALSRRRDFPARFLLTKPIRSQPLIDLLTELGSAQAGAGEGSGSVAWPVMAFGDDDALPLAEHLRRHTWNGPVMLGGDGRPELIIDTGAGCWYSGASDRELAGMLSHGIPASAGRILSSSELIDHTNGLEQQNLTSLKWRAGLALSEGALHPDLAGDVRLMLPQVPLQALSDTAYSRQARLLIRVPMTADTLLVESKADRADVTDFLNACHACGFLLLDTSGSATAHG